MKRLLLLVLASIIFSGCLKQKEISGNEASQMIDISSVKVTTPTPSAEAIQMDQEVDFTANFEIYTLGTKRIFTNSMYHNQSEQVYISADEPSKVHVKEKDLTWGNFFETLPFSVTKECLITGTGQEFCTSESGHLVFTLNGEDAPNVLDAVIQAGDKLVIKYER